MPMNWKVLMSMGVFGIIAVTLLTSLAMYARYKMRERRKAAATPRVTDAPLPVALRTEMAPVRRPLRFG